MSLEKKVSELLAIMSKYLPPSAPPAPSPMEVAVKERLGCTTLPVDLSWRSASVVKEPLIWLLVFDQDDVEYKHVRNAFGSRGVLLEAWRDQALSLFIPPRVRESDRAWFGMMIHKLEGKFLQLADLYFCHPSNKSAEDLLLICSSAVEEAIELIKEIEGKRLRITEGTKAASQFYRAFRLRGENYSYTFGPIVAKVSIKTNNTKTDDAESDDEEVETRKRPFNGKKTKTPGGKKKKKNWRKKKNSKANEDDANAEESD